MQGSPFPWSVDGLRRGSWVALQLRLGPFLVLLSLLVLGGGPWAEQRRLHDSPLLALLAPLCCCCCLIEHKTQDTHSTPKSLPPSATCVLSCLLSPTTAAAADCPSPPPYPSSRSKTPVLASQTLLRLHPKTLGNPAAPDILLFALTCLPVLMSQ
jgi:hypothetical protein